MPNEVVENPERHRFELAIDGIDEIAAAYYRIDDNGNLVLTHTEVPSEFSGQGIGSRLARGTFDLIRASGRKAVLQCPFMAAFYSRHPEYSDIVAG
jgi:uncharacterized protein